MGLRDVHTHNEPCPPTGRMKVVYLGYTVSSGGIELPSRKIQDIEYLLSIVGAYLRLLSTSVKTHPNCKLHFEAIAIATSLKCKLLLGTWRSLVCIFRKLSKSESNYSAYDRELCRNKDFQRFLEGQGLSFEISLLIFG